MSASKHKIQNTTYSSIAPYHPEVGTAVIGESVVLPKTKILISHTITTTTSTVVCDDPATTKPNTGVCFVVPTK
jgi:hypothetical protein